MTKNKTTMLIIVSILCIILLAAGLNLAAASAVEAATSGSCGDNVQWNYNTSSEILTVSGSGAMYDYEIYDSSSPTSGNYAPWMADYQKSIKTIKIESGVTNIGNNAFTNCTSVTDLSLGDDVTEIGVGSFGYCQKLPEVIFPAALTEIDDTAFANCDMLTEVTIPAAVTEVGAAAFGDCNNLSGIIVAAANTEYSANDGILYNKDQTELLCYPAGREAKTYAVAAGVTEIGEYAFLGSANLQTVSIPSEVTEIDDYAFCFCSNLQSLTIPAGVTEVSEGLFTYCTALTTVQLPITVTEIEYAAFAYCEKLKDLTIPEAVTSIGNAAFAYCSALTNITLPGTVTDIEQFAFSYCTALTGVEIKGDVTSIGDAAFAMCSDLKAAYFYGAAPKTFGGDVFTYCASGFKIYYINGNSGWTSPTWNGYATATFTSLAGTTVSNLEALTFAQKIHVDWDAVSSATGYDINVTYADGSLYKNYATTKTSCNFNNLVNGQQYKFKVRPYKTVDGTRVYGDYSVTVSAVPIANMVQNLSGTPFNKKIRLTWDAVDGADGYYIYAMYADSSKYKTYATTKTACNFTKLINGDAYQFKVREYKLNQAGSKVYGSYSSVISATPEMDAVDGLEALTMNKKIHVDWLAADGADSYYIYVTNADGSLYKTYVTKKTYCNFNKLTNGSDYSFKVRCCYKNSADTICYGKYCAAVTAAPVADIVSNLQAASYDKKIKISWDAVDGADGYYIYAMYGDGSKYKTYTTTKVTCNFTKLTNAKTYQFKVRAYQLNQSGVKVYSTYSGIVSAVAGA